MSTLAARTQSTTAPISNTDEFDIEPDDVWKKEMRNKIEHSLQTMVTEAKDNLELTLRQAPVTPERRERLTEEYTETMQDIRRFAAETFHMELERERLQRRWAAGQKIPAELTEVLKQEQQAIMDKIKHQEVRSERSDHATNVEYGPAPRPPPSTSTYVPPPLPPPLSPVPPPTKPIQLRDERERSSVPIQKARRPSDTFISGSPRSDEYIKTMPRRSGYTPSSERPPTLDSWESWAGSQWSPSVVDEPEEILRPPDWASRERSFVPVSRSAERAQRSLSERHVAHSPPKAIPEIWKPSISPEEDAAASRPYALARRGSTTSIRSNNSSSFRVPAPQPIPERPDDLDMVGNNVRERERPQDGEQTWSPVDKGKERSRPGPSRSEARQRTTSEQNQRYEESSRVPDSRSAGPSISSRLPDYKGPLPPPSSARPDATKSSTSDDRNQRLDTRQSMDSGYFSSVSSTRPSDRFPITSASAARPLGGDYSYMMDDYDQRAESHQPRYNGIRASTVRDQLDSHTPYQNSYQRPSEDPHDLPSRDAWGINQTDDGLVHRYSKRSPPASRPIVVPSKQPPRFDEYGRRARSPDSARSPPEHRYGTHSPDRAQSWQPSTPSNLDSYPDTSSRHNFGGRRSRDTYDSGDDDDEYLDVVAKRREEEARRKEEAARRKEEADREEDVRRKEEEALRKEAELKKKEMEVKRREEDIRKREEEAREREEARKREEEARRREEEAKKREEEAKKREEDAKKREEEAKRRREEEARRREEEARRREEEARREEEEARRLEEEAKREEEEVRRLEEEARWEEEEARREEEEEEARREEAARIEEEARKEEARREEAKRKQEELKRKEEAARRKEEAAKRKEEARLRKEEEARAKKLEEEVKKKEEQARKKEEEARRMEEEAKRKEEEAKAKEEEAMKRADEALKKEREAQRKEKEAQRKEREAQRKEKEAQKKDEEATRKAEAARQKEEETRLKEEAILRREEDLRRREEELNRREEESRKKEEERRLKDELQKEEEERQRQAEELKKQEEERLQREAEWRQQEEERRQLEMERKQKEEEERQRQEDERQRMQQQEEFRRREEEIRRGKRQDSMGGEAPWANLSASSPSRSMPQRPGSTASTASAERTGTPSWNTSTSSPGPWSIPRTASNPASKPRTGSMGAGPSPSTPSPHTNIPEKEWHRRNDEQAREREEQFRREQERLELERQAKAAGKGMSKEQVIQLFETHERQWANLAVFAELRWENFPWPMFKRPSIPEDITGGAISAYINSPLYPEKDKSRPPKDRIKEHIRRWHPDRFETKLLTKVIEADKERVREAASSVIRGLNDLLAKSNAPSMFS